MDYHLSRRSLLKGGLALAATSLFVPTLGLAAKRTTSLCLDKKLALYNMHTGEWFKQNYMENGVIVPESVQALQVFLRDHRNNQTHPIDIDLIHLVHTLQQQCSPHKPFDIISGYRSPESNALLRRHNKGVARNSYHMKGQAIDIKAAKNLKLLRDCARALKRGGVGYYPQSNFIHVDIREQPTYWGAA
jgi:Uncharacterized protein conserved in bacteria